MTMDLALWGVLQDILTTKRAAVIRVSKKYLGGFKKNFSLEYIRTKEINTSLKQRYKM